MNDNTTSEELKTRDSKYIVLALVSSAGLLIGFYIFWFNRIGNDWDKLGEALVPNIITNFLTFLVVKFLYIDFDESVSLKSLNSTIEKNTILTNALSQYVKESLYYRFNVKKTVPNYNIELDDSEMDVMLKLQPAFNSISKSLFEFKNKYSNFLPFLMSIFNERVDEIESIASGDYKFKTEIHRESFTNKLFEHLTALQEITLIQSLTWDDDKGYFLDYWKSYVTEQEFMTRNRNAEKKDIETQRIIVLKRDDKLASKFETLGRILFFNSPYLRSTVRWFYEDDIIDKFPNYVNTKSSFLMLLDESKRVRLITENYQFKIGGKDKDSDVRISKGDAASERISRFESLWDVPYRDLDEELKKLEEEKKHTH